MARPSTPHSPAPSPAPRRLLRRLLQGVAGLIAIPIVAVIAALAVLYVQGHRAPGGAADHVVIGSSFAARPGIGERAEGGSSACMRSNDNCAHLLARERGLSRVDVSRSGAVTRHVLHGGQGVRQRAPNARLVFVDDLTVLPAYPPTKETRVRVAGALSTLPDTPNAPRP